MRYTLAFSLLCLFSACALNNYTQLWNRVDVDAEGEKATKHLQIVKSIYRHALASGDLPNQARAGIMIARLTGKTSDEREAAEYKILDSLIRLQKGSVKALLLSRKARILDEFQDKNTNEVQEETDDIRKWGKDYLEKEATAAYLASLKDTTILQHELLSWYTGLLLEEKENRFLRPTLYDLLAHRALGYFHRNTRQYNIITDTISFAPAAVFTTGLIKDSTDHINNSLEIYRKLLRFHAKQNNIEALVYADIYRLDFVKNHTGLLNKEQLYEQAMEQLQYKYANREIGTLCAYELADHYHTKAEKTKDTTTRKMLYAKAMSLCNAGSPVFTNSEGSKNCQVLKRKMLMTKLSIKAESVNEPGKPFRMLVNYRNINNMHIRLIRVDQAFNLGYIESHEEEKEWSMLLGLPVQKSWQQPLHDPLDYSEHFVEIKVDALETGKYILIASSDKNFNFNTSRLAAQFVQVSNISFITADGVNFYALHRSTGAPLKGVTLSLKEDKEQLTFTTNDEGRIHVKYKEGWEGYPSSTWINGTDTLHMNDASFFADNINNAEEEEEEAPEESIRSYYFADRRIYRPGQTMYFKGIRTKGESANNRLVTDAPVKVWLRDHNNRKIDSLSLRSNAFGSYAGAFKLPPNLSGSFSISDDGDEGGLYIFVEEYKRPKFEVTFDSVKAAYRLYDSVRITGHAIAFSGNNLSNAKVKWRVKRNPDFSYTMDHSMAYVEVNMTMSETTTDATGNFVITFFAASDRSKEEAPEAMFHYTITADVTDANGETRTGSYRVQVGYQTMLLYTTINEQTKLSELSAIGIASRNTNGAFIPIPVNITFTRLNHPGRLMRERYWEQPDQFVMTEKEYHQYFPLDIYKDENDPSTWSKGKVYSAEGITGDGKKWDFSKMGLSSGTYEVLITGKEATKKQIVKIISKENNTDPAYTWYFDHDRILQPGDVAHITLGASGNTWLLQQDDKFTMHTLTGTLAKIDIPIKEADRGNRSVALAYVKDNRLFTYDCTLEVPWSNKQLDISIAAHRNKILPGAKETWSLTVKAPGNKKAPSELTATMYDASLDEISTQEWEVPPFYETRDNIIKWNGELNFSLNTSLDRTTEKEPEWIRSKNFDKLAEAELYEPIYGDPNGLELLRMSAPVVASYSNFQGAMDNAVFKVEDSVGAAPPPPSSPRPRKDFRETAFFIPQLQINGQGSITFTMPEALTKWNFRAFAHTKELQFGLATSQVITQKPLMVTPNAPRFLREGDKVELSTKISNVTNAQLTGKVKLELLDPDNMESLNKQFSNILPVQNFTAAGGQSTAVTFQLKVPQGYTKPLIYRFTAESGKFTDGEESLLPVLSNRILITESMPIYIRGNGKKDYTFEKLLLSSNSPTLQHQGITVTYNCNPIWYAIQSLPYLMEFPHECAEQTFSRYYANAVATQILKSTPKAHAVIKRLNTTNLEKDAELKSALLEETPWVKEAQTENHLAALLDLQKMSLESDKAFKQLQAMQLPNGAFPWFGGMEANSYITQHILTGIGRLKMMKVPVPDGIVKKALHYLDSSRSKENILDLHYLYMRSFFPNAPSTNKQLEKNWQKQSVYAKGMIALILFRSGNITTAKKIMQDLKENATQSEEMGMYWSSVESGYYWYEAPVETQALLIEAFTTITQDQPTVDALKTWLLRQKQTNSWSTTRSTTDACYALLMNGTDWLNTTPETKITIGEETLTDKDGIIKARFEEKKINTKMAKVQLNVKGNGTQPSWGSVYWQYFEQLDKITPSKSGLSVQRELYLGNTRISATQALHVGDKVTMRIILKADRDMEFVHLKDMRPACLEPIDVISMYKNGYYQSTKDLATHFFFDRVRKGTYILEYSLFVSHAGNYAGGISTAQCMYAPEFNANSAGMNVVVE